MLEITEKYRSAVNHAVSVIIREVEKGKSRQYIRDQIYYDVLMEIGITDVSHFDRYYFKKCVGKNINNFIKDLKSARVEMQQYVCYYKSAAELGVDAEETILIAISSEDAIKQFLDVMFLEKPEKVLKKILFEDFFVSSGYGEIDELKCFENKKAIFEIIKDLRVRYFLQSDEDPELLFEKVCEEIEDLKERYWYLLNEKERKLLYYWIYKDDVICKKCLNIAQRKKKISNNVKNVIEDAEDIDYLIMNTISDVIRQETKEWYDITIDSFLQAGYNMEVSKMYIDYCMSGNLKYHVFYENEQARFIVGYLLDAYPEENVVDNNKAVYKIRPRQMLYDLVGANYDFRDKKNALVETILFGNYRDNRKN